MNKKALDPADCGVIALRSGRRFVSLFRAKGIRAVTLGHKVLGHKKLRERQRARRILELDCVIEKIALGGVFQLFTFDSVTSVNQVLITHHKCRRVVLVEEGTLHHYPIEFLKRDQLTSPSNQALYCAQHSARFFTSGVTCDIVDSYVSFSGLSFGGSNPLLIGDWGLASNLSRGKELGVVIALDGYNSWADLKRQSKQLDGFLKEKGIVRMSLKAHPATSWIQWMYWLGTLAARGYAIQMVSEKTILESELANGTVSLLVGWGSSSLKHAQILGVDFYDLLVADSSDGVE